MFYSGHVELQGFTLHYDEECVMSISIINDGEYDPIPVVVRHRWKRRYKEEFDRNSYPENQLLVLLNAGCPCGLTKLRELIRHADTDFWKKHILVSDIVFDESQKTHFWESFLQDMMDYKKDLDEKNPITRVRLVLFINGFQYNYSDYENVLFPKMCEIGDAFGLINDDVDAEVDIVVNPKITVRGITDPIEI